VKTGTNNSPVTGTPLTEKISSIPVTKPTIAPQPEILTREGTTQAELLERETTTQTEILATEDSTHREILARESVGTVQTTSIATGSSQQISSYVNFLNTVSAVSSLLIEEGKNKQNQIIHSPTDVLVTPFTPQSEIETTTTVTVVTTDGAEEVGDVAMETSQQPEVEVQDISQTVELVEESNEQ